jgi:putative heme-binding domain-containing protein
MPHSGWVVALTLVLGPVGTQAQGPDLAAQLLHEDPAELAKAARAQGDPVRGAVLFHQPHLSCTKCHAAGGAASPFGPDLAKPEPGTTDAHFVESVLAPSKVIRKGFETVTVTRTNGSSLSGLLVEERKDALVLRDPAKPTEPITIPKADIDERVTGKTSLMPAGLANLLTDRRQFLDLVSYLIEIAEFGPARARSLRPDPDVIDPPLPDYENDLDHRGLIAGLDDAARRRGEAVYSRLCVTCHGTKDRPGSMPTSLPFWSGKFRNGSDPFAMYKTVTRGSGLMPRQPTLVPQEKYDVIHFIREKFLRPSNPTQYTAVDETYLARLPKGTSRGPVPPEGAPWAKMDYGPNLFGTFEVGGGGTNIAYKGIAVRLDPGSGGVARGKAWVLYEHDTMRAAAGWTGTGFIDWSGVNFDGQHEVHPHIVGKVMFESTGPGWANPETGTFDDPQIKGRDGKPYGPFPKSWMAFKGLYHAGDRAVLSYTVGTTEVLESPGLSGTELKPVFTRSIQIGPRAQDLVMMVARVPTTHAGKVTACTPMVFGPPPGEFAFLGRTSLEVERPEAFDLKTRDYAVSARIKTKVGGTIFAQAPATGPWAPDGKALFVRGGRLAFDIGWVGVVEGRTKIDDGKWHEVAMCWDHATGMVTLFVDGKADGSGTLKPKGAAAGMAVRIGFASPDFPRAQSYFDGEMSEVRFYDRKLAAGDLKELPKDGVVARWDLSPKRGRRVADATGNKHDAVELTSDLGIGTVDAPDEALWLTGDGTVRLRLPAGKDPLRFTLWLDAGGAGTTAMKGFLTPDLKALTHGGPAHWKESLSTHIERGPEDGTFAVDVLPLPTTNPWRAQVRMTGLDFLPDGTGLYACAWDGDVWKVTGLDRADGALTWRRIASGLHQPLGLKVVGKDVYVCCRDQIVILRDMDGDGETDFFECFNTDHQVTEHFHEFAMGLQTDEAGNFYYAKGARHAKTALVPQHGTLLKVSKDGSKTEILATGFRAPNGVCVNPDGTFFVTDQEGHWTPKNRINWVRPGQYYGNAWGYRESDDLSDEAMDQPVCWITNRFDRSPGEVVRVEGKSWGPLAGSLLNLSYGTGKVFVIPHEQIGDEMQGGMVALPIPAFPTGVMRGRFHPKTGDFYCCGMFAWAGDRQVPGGLYRIRATGKPMYLPVAFHATKDGLALTFSEPLAAESVADVKNFGLKVWDLKRSANYGSPHLNEKALKVTAATLSTDRKTVTLTVPGLAPTRGLELWYSVIGADGRPVDGLYHGSILRMGE